MRVPVNVGRLLVCIVGVLCFCPAASAQQSWIWARSDHARPINLKTDSISILLLESRVPSGNNFLAHDTQVGLLVDTKFTGSTAAEPQAKRDFPFMFEETADALNDPSHPHSKDLSKQETLVGYFPLTDGKTVYRSVSISVKLLRKQDKNVWVKVFQTLLNATKGVTLPSPLTVGVNYLSTFSNDVLSDYLPAPGNKKLIDLGTFSFLLSDNPSELNRVAESGLHLRILPPTGTGPGWVDPSRWDSYCFYTKFSSTNWSVLVAKKDASAPDKDAEGCPRSKYTQLMNDYVPILIEAEQTPGLVTKIANASPGEFTKVMADIHLGMAPTVRHDAVKLLQSRAKDMRAAALAQCAAFHVAKCPTH